MLGTWPRLGRAQPRLLLLPLAGVAPAFAGVDLWTCLALLAVGPAATVVASELGGRRRLAEQLDHATG